MKGDGPLRFKRPPYRGKNSRDGVPIWHRAAQQYTQSWGYKQGFVALCGYTYGEGDILKYVELSRREFKTAKILCQKCEKKAAELNV